MPGRFSHHTVIQDCPVSVHYDEAGFVSLQLANGMRSFSVYLSLAGSSWSVLCRYPF